MQGSYECRRRFAVPPFKTELLRNRGAGRGLDHVELATLAWVDWSIDPRGPQDRLTAVVEQARSRLERNYNRANWRPVDPQACPYGRLRSAGFSRLTAHVESRPRQLASCIGAAVGGLDR